MHSRDVKDLHAAVQPLAVHMISLAQSRGIAPLIACTYRDDAEQDLTYSYGRTTKSPIGPWNELRPLGAILTRARAGQSAHNHHQGGVPMALALDVYPTVGGKLVTSASSPLWVLLGDCGHEAGLEWYGEPDQPFKEYPHFTLPNWKAIMFHVEQSGRPAP